jgi:hypothetical protein
MIPRKTSKAKAASNAAFLGDSSELEWKESECGKCITFFGVNPGGKTCPRNQNRPSSPLVAIADSMIRRIGSHPALAAGPGYRTATA